MPSRRNKSKNKEGKCVFCNTDNNDNVNLGEFYSKDDISCHYYCLLFSCGIQQNGDDEDGICGFLLKDIKNEVRRGSRLTCRYCKKKGATSACCLEKCKIMFHLPCGIKNLGLFQFFGQFSSYCKEHRPVQAITALHRKFLSKECPICFSAISYKPPLYDTLLTPCCHRWLHRDCVQTQANSAGYFFRCPLCNEKEKFVKEMTKFGIFVLEKDASWELEANAFRELHETNMQCDANECFCPSGRKYDEEDTPWDIVVCCLCASQGAHVGCGNINDDQLRSWTCSICSVVQNKRKAEETSSTKRIKLDNNENEDTMNINVISI